MTIAYEFCVNFIADQNNFISKKYIGVSPSNTPIFCLVNKNIPIYKIPLTEKGENQLQTAL